MENNKDECTDNQMEIQTENACGCSENLPDEYFYNSCKCENRDTENADIICSCGSICNPLGLDDENYCNCSGENIF